MDSVILQGPDAIEAAICLKNKLGVEAFDLGPDFGQDTARVWLAENTANYVELVENWRDVDGWFDAVGTDFRVMFDGPPFRMGGEVSVAGTRL